MISTFEDVRDWAAERATDWALDKSGADRLTIDDFSPASALRIEAFNLLMPLAVSAAGLTSDFGSAGVSGVLKRSGLDRGARAWAQRLFARTPGREATQDQRAPIAFVSELATPSTLEPMLAVAGALPAGSWSVVTADPRADRRWRADGAAPHPAILPWREQQALLRTWTAAARERWAGIAAEPPSFVLDKIDLSREALSVLKPLVLRSLPWLGVERRALFRRLDALSPLWIVLASDQHRLGRVATGWARANGARSLVLQHGLPQYSVGYLPVVADLVATWSETSDGWFLRGGTPPNRLLRLGNPRLDVLARAEREHKAERVATRLGLSGHPRLLLTLSPSDAARNLELVDLAVAAIASTGDGSLVVKLHPGDGRSEAVRQRLGATGPLRHRIRLQKREPLYPLLLWADLTLLHRSSVAVESLAAGTPVALAGTGREKPGDALPDDLRLPEVTTAESVLALAGEISGVERREAWVAERADAIERSIGPQDGGSARRIAALLTAERVR